MRRFIIRRLLSAIPTIFVVTLLVYALVLLVPGHDPATFLLGEESDPELLAYFRKELGLDRSLPAQYAHWVGGLVTGDMGRSMRTNEPITKEVVTRFKVTGELAFGALVLSLLIALPIGVYSAARPNSWGDNLGTVFAIGGAALPNFWLGIMLIYIFAVILGWLPATGYVKPFDDPIENLRRMVMPVLMTGTVSAASTMRQTRSGMLEVLQQDYIRTAHAKGLAERSVLIRHALKNALIPVTTIMGLLVAQLLSGTAITEIMFRIPGLGQFAVKAALRRDIPALQGALVFFGSIVLLANLAVDLLYGFLDPRIRYT